MPAPGLPVAGRMIAQPENECLHLADPHDRQMRRHKELRAQEKANKLPVKMSAVMAALMIPTLLMIRIFPVIIRWINVMTM